jgi:S1-C subfamily serine protease
VLHAQEAGELLYTGVELGANESDTLESLEVLPGARVVRIDPSSPGARAGLQAGDVVLAVQGTPMRDGDGFDAIVRGAGPGRSLELETRRDTVVFAATLIPVAASGAEPPRELFRSDPVRSRADYRTALVALDGKPVPAARLERLHQRSPLPDAGLEPGDAIVALDGEPVASAQDLVRRLIDEREPGASVRLTVVRGSETREARVRLWRPSRVLTQLTLLPLQRYEHDPRRDATRFALLDLWLFALFSYERQAGEVEYRILHFIRFGSGEGELR